MRKKVVSLRGLTPRFGKGFRFTSMNCAALALANLTLLVTALVCGKWRTSRIQKIISWGKSQERAYMQLLTEELKKRLPSLYSTEEMQDPQVICRYFLPMTKMEWFVTEFDGKETFFGYVVGQYPELGYFSLSELRLARGPFGLEVERDRFFSPLPLSKMKSEIKGGSYATL